MKYEIIDKDLNIAACHIADLDMDFVNNTLRSWDDNSRIGSLTLFVTDDKVVLNKDYKFCNYVRRLVVAYLSSDEEDREKIRLEVHPGFNETLETLDRYLDNRKIQKAISDIERVLIDEKYIGAISNIAANARGCTDAAFNAFRYGLICGKREERARRKKAVRND